MTYDLSGKIAVVTGGSRGIGAASAERLARDGAHVILTYNSSPAAANDVAAAIEADGGKVTALQVNAADPEAAKIYVDAARDLGGIDILVHNAGIARYVGIDNATYEEFRRQFGVNVDGVFAGTIAAVPHLNKGASIIVISSINAHTVPAPGGTVYGATKAAATAMVKGWARDLGSRNIRVNAVQPGPIDTDMNPANGDFADFMRNMTALGRYGHADEVAALVAFLASDEASYITGAAIDIDGGMTV